MPEPVPAGVREVVTDRTWAEMTRLMVGPLGGVARLLTWNWWAHQGSCVRMSLDHMSQKSRRVGASNKA